MADGKNNHHLSGTEQLALIAACQYNEYLALDGRPWLIDATLRDYPYQFETICSAESLRGFFADGPWPLRQGAIYGDLAFIQQVNWKDDWWTLKHVANNGLASDWLPIDSLSFDAMIEEPERFVRTINGLLEASPQECFAMSHRVSEIYLINPLDAGRSGRQSS